MDLQIWVPPERACRVQDLVTTKPSAFAAWCPEGVGGEGRVGWKGEAAGKDKAPKTLRLVDSSTGSEVTLTLSCGWSSGKFWHQLRFEFFSLLSRLHAQHVA